ncbi:MAG: hypothetical protein EBY62_10180 [Cellvibrionales bacterium]|nr:hypothetical protein [Cellvibrionales bacterium]
MYRITIHEKSFFTDTEERSHHHFDSAEAALRFLAALETPRKIFVSEVYGHYWQPVRHTGDWRCAECGQYQGPNTHPQCPGDEIDAAYKQLADDMAFESWREDNR